MSKGISPAPGPLKPAKAKFKFGPTLRSTGRTISNYIVIAFLFSMSGGPNVPYLYWIPIDIVNQIIFFDAAKRYHRALSVDATLEGIY